MSEFLLAVEERVTVQVDMRVVDALPAEGVADPFAGHSGSHKRYDVPHSASQFEHDDNKGH